MHRALVIPEIFLLILHASDGERQLQMDRTTPRASTAAALARTCRRFLEPGLNVAWSDLNDISALLRVLPEDLWVLERPKGWRPFFRPRGLVRPS